MCPYSERGLAIFPGILLYLNGLVCIECVAECHLLGFRVNTQRTVFPHDFSQLLPVVSAVHPQSFEEIGEVLRKVEAEYVPTESVVQVGAQRAPERLTPGIHRYVVRHLRTVHSSYGRYEFMGHRAYRGQVIFHGQIHVAGSHEFSVPLTTRATIFHGPDYRVFRHERGAAACPEIAEPTTGIQ